MELPTPTFPLVIREFIEFVNCIVFDVVLPVAHVCCNEPVVVMGVDVILLIRPLESTVKTGTFTPEPYVPDVVTPAVFERNKPDPKNVFAVTFPSVVIPASDI